jgi:hypothetical protein
LASTVSVWVLFSEQACHKAAAIKMMNADRVITFMFLKGRQLKQAAMMVLCSLSLGQMVMMFFIIYLFLCTKPK